MTVKGMTTASTIWIVGAFGIACGLGYYFLAGVTLVLALIILVVFGRVERRLLGSPTREDPAPAALPPGIDGPDASA
jgi:putative Mg2+ transporter-C (MgtC) family protein